MKRIETSLPDMFDLRPVIHRDARGFFIETCSKAKFAVLSIADASFKTIIRGFAPGFLTLQSR